MLRLIRPSLVSQRAFVRSLATQAPPPPEKPTTTNETLSKFWTHVNISTTVDSYAIELDSKPIKTPLGNPLSVPQSRQQLAHLIHHEWSTLSGTIKTHSLPLTSLTSRVIDLKGANESKDEEAMTKVGKREDIIEMLLRYLDTDTLLVFCPKLEYEGDLRKAQEELYRPVIASVEKFLGVEELTYLDADRDGLRGNKQSEETREKARQYLLSLNYWDLATFEKITLTTKSYICALLVLMSKTDSGLKNPELNFTLEEIAHLASLEIKYQTDRWGEVEDTHDVDYQDLRRQINSAALVCYQPRS